MKKLSSVLVAFGAACMGCSMGTIAIVACWYAWQESPAFGLMVAVLLLGMGCLILGHCLDNGE